MYIYIYVCVQGGRLHVQLEGHLESSCAHMQGECERRYSILHYREKKNKKKQRTAKVPKYKFRIGQEQLPGYWCFWRQRVCWKERNSFIRVLQDFPRKEAEIL